jgi:hypothetical protein
VPGESRTADRSGRSSPYKARTRGTARAAPPTGAAARSRCASRCPPAFPCAEPACGVRKFDPPRNRGPRGPCGRYLTRAPLGSSRHINKERNRGQRTPSRTVRRSLGPADRPGAEAQPEDETRVALAVKRQFRGGSNLRTPQGGSSVLWNGVSSPKSHLNFVKAAPTLERVRRAG